MEDSKAQQKIIDLGKIIVKELQLDPGADTLAKWMAHYVAEKIDLAEKLTGIEKNYAQKECFEIVLKLWEHRWSASRGVSFLRDFEPLFETLEKLNPNNKEAPFFLSPIVQFDFQGKNEKRDTIEAKSNFDAALRVDRLARSLIWDLLNQAVLGLELTSEKRELIRNAIDLIDYPDIRIIRITSAYNEAIESQEDEKRERIEEIQKKIKELEEFTSLKDSLLDRYKKELSEIEK